MTAPGLHLVRIPVDPMRLAAYAVAEDVADDDRGYAMHLALRRRYGAAAPQPFRLFDTTAAPHVLGYAMDAAALADAAALPPADPELDAVLPGAPACRPMPDGWRSGARYGFEVRVRPVVRYGGRVRALRAADAASWQPRAGEMDAFAAARARAARHRPDGGSIEEDGPGGETDRGLDRDTVYRAWLCARLAGAATIERAALRQVRGLSTRRSSHGRPGARVVEGHEAVFAGILAVADGAAFAQLLARGVGRHAAFGFGMLMLAPPGA